MKRNRIPLAPQSKRGTRAFTIVEVAIAAFVLLLGIASSIVTIQSGFRTMDDARNLTIASQLLQSELERLRLLPWASDTGGLSVSRYWETDVNGNLVEPQDVELDSFFTTAPKLTSKYEMYRTVVPTSGRENSMCDITLTVSWTSIYGLKLSRTFITRYCKDGLYDYYYTIAN